MSVLVTGGKGFVGAAMIRKLVDSGEEVVNLDLKTTPGRLGETAERITMLGGGMPDLDGLCQLIRDHRVDRIAHMVFNMSGANTPEKIPAEVSTMVMSTANVFEAARQTGLKRVLFPSSIHFFGPQWLHGEVWLDEESTSLAESVYGIGKKMNETMAARYNMSAGMSIISMRLPAVYGPGGRVGARGVNIAAVECALNKPAVFPYRAEQKVCAAHVDDVVDALLLGLTTANPKHMVYNIGGHIATYWELAQIVRERLPEAEITYNEGAGMSDLAYLIDCSRLKEEFGFDHRPLTSGYWDLINLTRMENGLPEV